MEHCRVPVLAVKECLREYVTGVAAALQELHGINYAHLDVSVPNICFAFAEGYIVKLIDLDRCQPTSDRRYALYKGEMYLCDTFWTCEQLDWKQLGLLTAAIIFDCSHEDVVCKHAEKVRNDDFLNGLIFKGECYNFSSNSITALPYTRVLQ